MALPAHLSGVVTRVDLSTGRPRVFALVPRIGGAAGELGPVRYVDPRDRLAPTGATAANGEDEHTHQLEAAPFPYAPGDRVLVGLLDGNVDAPVILGPLV